MRPAVVRIGGQPQGGGRGVFHPGFVQAGRQLGGDRRDLKGLEQPAGGQFVVHVSRRQAEGRQTHRVPQQVAGRVEQGGYPAAAFGEHGQLHVRVNGGVFRLLQC